MQVVLVLNKNRAVVSILGHKLTNLGSRCNIDYTTTTNKFYTKSKKLYYYFALYDVQSMYNKIPSYIDKLSLHF